MSATLFFEGINITISLSPSPPPEDPGSPIPPPVNCTRTMTIDCLKYIYNIGGYQPSATNKNAIGITGYLNQYANIADLQSFYAAERPDAVNSTFKTVLVHSARALRWALLFVWEDDLTFVVCGTWQMGRTTSP
jgi:tripeptidyl-peptidase-1